MDYSAYLCTHQSQTNTESHNVHKAITTTVSIGNCSFHGALPPTRKAGSILITTMCIVHTVQV